jgi:hypothetical protein
MKHAFSFFSRSTPILSLIILSILCISIFIPGQVQAFGSLTENGTAAFMGIGINPTKILHVSGTGPGTVPLFQRGADSAGFIIERTPTNRWVLGVNESPTLGNGFVLSTIPFGTTSVPRLLVTPSGNVGIGTTNPASGKLEVQTLSGAAIFGENQGDYGEIGANQVGVVGVSPSGTGVLGSTSSGMGVRGVTATGYAGYFDGYTYVSGNCTVANNLRVQTGKVAVNIDPDSSSQLTSYSSGGNGVYGKTDTWNGVLGTATSGTGVAGSSTSHFGVLGTGTDEGSFGVRGESTSGTGVYGQGGKYAGYFTGYTYVSGNLTVTGQFQSGNKYFKIDHPQDPENKYLQHSVVESPDIKNVYDGTIMLDGNGEAVVQLPSYFESLNRDFRYQLTCIGEPAILYIAEKISNNHFKIAGGAAGMEVSWQVTGIRKDAFANAHPVVVEQEKPAGEKGYYLHAAEWGQPAEKGIASLQNK